VKRTGHRVEEARVDVGIGLPNAVEGASREQMLEWARRADSRGFSSLGTIDRVRYGNYEPLASLAAAAAVSERIRLATTVLLAPLRVNGVALAKQALSVHALSGGRLTLGLGLGAREDDYEVSDVEQAGRGARFEQMLRQIRGVWDGDEIGPPVERPPELILGGHVAASFARVARYADGWIASGSGPDQFRDDAERVRAAWEEAGRGGRPRLQALAYFALGDSAEQDARTSLGHYYAWLGEEVAGAIIGGAAKDADTVRSYLSAYGEAGCDELVLFPSSSDPAQVDLLADAAGL
jgi:alkanesulfonate monooxygenase SsuD/methylene tetrahydromethanopterin reductase-like flavin-dependent oxidoreductase (luciferase family)